MSTYVDYAKLNASIIDLDPAIYASSMVNKEGTLLAHSVRRGYENKLGMDKTTESLWGPWIVVMVGVARQSDKFLTEMEYIAIGRKEYKGLLIPVERLGVIIRLTLEKNTEATYICDKVRMRLMAMVTD